MNAGTIAMVLGAAFAAALFGALVGWIIRRIVPISIPLSYLIGVVIVAFGGSYLYTLSTPTFTYLEAFSYYGPGAALGFVILMLTLKEKPPATEDEE